LALLEAHPILHVSRLRVNAIKERRNWSVLSFNGVHRQQTI